MDVYSPDRRCPRMERTRNEIKIVCAHQRPNGSWGGEMTGFLVSTKGSPQTLKVQKIPWVGGCWPWTPWPQGTRLPCVQKNGLKRAPWPAIVADSWAKMATGYIYIYTYITTILKRTLCDAYDIIHLSIYPYFSWTIQFLWREMIRTWEDWYYHGRFTQSRDGHPLIDRDDNNHSPLASVDMGKSPH